MCVSDVSMWVIIGSGIGMLPFQQQAKSYLNQCWFIVNTLRPRQDGLHFPDNIFKYTFLNKNAWILIKIWLEFVPKGLIPTSALARRPLSPAFEERMRAAMGTTGEPSAGRPPYTVWHVYWFLLVSTRDIKICNNLYLSFLPQMIIIFKIRQYYVQRYAVIQVISSHYTNPSLIIFFSENLIVKSHGRFAL